MWHVFSRSMVDCLSRARQSRANPLSRLPASCAPILRRSQMIEPYGSFIERAELDAHYDEGRFPDCGEWCEWLKLSSAVEPANTCSQDLQ